MPRQQYYCYNCCYITSQVFKVQTVHTVCVTKAKLWLIFKGLTYPLDSFYHFLVIRYHQYECHYIGSIHASAAFCSVICQVIQYWVYPQDAKYFSGYIVFHDNMPYLYLLFHLILEYRMLKTSSLIAEPNGSWICSGPCSSVVGLAMILFYIF